MMFAFHPGHGLYMPKVYVFSVGNSFMAILIFEEQHKEKDSLCGGKFLK
jgi:hypothetical protein